MLLRPEFTGPDTFPHFEAEIAALTGDTTASSAGGPLDHRVHRLVTDILNLSHEAPLLLLVDDVHLLDPQTSQVLEALGNTTRFLSREGEPEPRLSLVETLPSHAMEPGTAQDGVQAVRLVLPAVSQTAYPRLLMTFLGAPTLPPGLIEEAWQVTQGNPGLTLDFLAHVRAAEALRRSPLGLQFQLDRLTQTPVPSGTRAHVERSLTSMHPDEVSVLQVLSQSFLVLADHEIAATALLPPWRTAMVLDSHSRRGIVTSMGSDGRRGWALSSLMMADVVRCTMDEKQVDALHLRILDAAMKSDHPGVGALLAWHGAQAGRQNLLEDHLEPAVGYLLSRSMFARARALCDLARHSAVPVRVLAGLYFDVFRLWGGYVDGIEVLRGLVQPEDTSWMAATDPA